jgi:hypothetical protein
MRLPQTVRIITEDLPNEVTKWVGKLVDPLNNFMLTMRNGLNKGITVNDNMAGSIKTYTVIGNSLTFEYKSSRRPSVVLLGGWVDLTINTWTPTTLPGICKWDYANEKLNCTFLGLDSTHRYLITLLILDD